MRHTNGCKPGSCVRLTRVKQGRIRTFLVRYRAKLTEIRQPAESKPEDSTKLTRAKTGRISRSQRQSIRSTDKHNFPAREIDRNGEQMRFIRFRESTLRHYVYEDPNGVYDLLSQWHDHHFKVKEMLWEEEKLRQSEQLKEQERLWEEAKLRHEERLKQEKELKEEESLKAQRPVTAKKVAGPQPRKLEDWETELIARFNRNLASIPEQLEEIYRSSRSETQSEDPADKLCTPAVPCEAPADSSSRTNATVEVSVDTEAKCDVVKEETPAEESANCDVMKEAAADMTANCDEINEAPAGTAAKRDAEGRTPEENPAERDDEPVNCTAATQSQNDIEPASLTSQSAFETLERDHSLMEERILQLERKKRELLEEQKGLLQCNTRLFKTIRAEAKTIKQEQEELEKQAALKKQEAEAMEKRVKEFQSKEDDLVNRLIGLDIGEQSKAPKQEAVKDDEPSTAAPPDPEVCDLKPTAEKKVWQQPTAKDEPEE
ncbi:hypothetical protein CBER1_11353 [Cercospora berteroae]|uniref:Uncharacterized protein n=1 Tax=Cercospora berteroae TaxID=357750 RepID=A0A2S6BZ25_9PEZI|nr:hypothetical protein CBER1_11353 [Cercospora berteroae]